MKSISFKPNSEAFCNIICLFSVVSAFAAVALAVALQVKKCYIFSDVDGVYSADPKIDKNADRIKRHARVRAKISGTPEKVRAKELPESFTLSDCNIVTDIYSQGSYNTCWAISARWVWR